MALLLEKTRIEFASLIIEVSLKSSAKFTGYVCNVMDFVVYTVAKRLNFVDPSALEICDG